MVIRTVQIHLFCFLIICIFLSSCVYQSEKNDSIEDKNKVDDNQLQVDPKQDSYCPLEDSLQNWGLVNVKLLVPTIKVHLRYATKDNFLNQPLYDCLKNAFLQSESTLALAKAQQYLKSLNDSLSLLVWDAVRPLHVQQKMWDALDMPIPEKFKYVSNPKNGSVHNYGCAVDITICDINEIPLDMGTDFDYFGKKAQATQLTDLVEEGLISTHQMNNRLLLQKVMKHAGFTLLPAEWWHFNFGSRDVVKNKYAIVR